LSLDYECRRRSIQTCSNFIFITRYGKIQAKEIEQNFTISNTALAINQFIDSSQQSTFNLTREFWIRGLLVMGIGMISMADAGRFIFLRQKLATQLPQKG